MIKVSVIIPFYNRGYIVNECLNQVLKQTLREIEIICVDDGSLDNTSEALNTLQKKDNRIKVISKMNGGAGSARNEGLKVALGEYIAFLDSDDNWVNDKVLEQLYNISVKNDASLCKAKLFVKRTDEIKLMEETVASEVGFKDFRNIKSGYYFYSYLYKRELLERNKILFPDLYIYEDPPFLISAMIKAKKIYCSNIDYYIYNNMHQKEIIRNEKQTIDYLKGLAICLKITSKYNLPELHLSVYEDLVVEASNDFIRNVPSDNKELLTSLLRAYNELNSDFLLNEKNDEGFTYPTAFNYMWQTSNNYLIIRKNKIVNKVLKIFGKK